MKFLISLLVVFLFGCTHTINISSNLNSVKNKSEITNKKIGFYISPANRDKEVTDSTTGGDKVAYYPYRDLESSIYKVLFEAFKDVRKMDSFPSESVLKEQGVSYVFIPEVITEASNDSIFFWPPTRFKINLGVKAIDSKGQIAWTKNFEKTGEATRDEWRENFGAAGSKANELVMKEFLEELLKSPLLN
jgi:hypothetical protein